MSVEQQLRQLDEARKLVLGDANYYPQIIQGILPIIGPDARVELRRWGADFLAETFSTPVLATEQKETLSLIALETLKSIIEKPNEDVGVVKSVVQTAASIYPLVLRWIINNPYDSPTWERMTAIKSRIFRIWDTAPPGIRICCIKFAQRVILAQTMGVDGDVKRAEPMEISLAMVPPNHPLVPARNMEAEASGLLDRMLGVFHENISDAVLIDATINSLSVLIRARPPISNKILNALLNFNPLKLANSPMTPKLRVIIKSIEKTTRMLLIHISKRDTQNPLMPRIHQQIERLIRSRTEIFEEATRKRGFADSGDALASSKRQRIGVTGTSNAQNHLHIPQLGPGPHTVAQLFTISTDEGLKTFDVSVLPQDIIIKITATILSRLDDNVFSQAVNGVRGRLEQMKTVTPEQLDPNTALLSVDEDDDDYEPDFQTAEDSEQILNKLDNAPPPEEPRMSPAEVSLGPFKLPPPPPLSDEEVIELGNETVARMFNVMQVLEESSTKKAKAGINRLAASTYDRDAWVTVVTRLATRATIALEGNQHDVKAEPESGRVTISDTIRESLYGYVLEDFRKRIDIAVQWLCEEWYAEKVQAKYGQESAHHYSKWALRILDGVLPYLDARDKFLTRFLSEVPSLTAEMFDRVKGLCRDPAMVRLALTGLLYLVKMRPPVRELALDAVEDIWRTYDDSKDIAGPILAKFRPGFVEQQKSIKEAGES